MAADEVDEYELEKLRAEIQQEKQMKQMLDQSANELRITVEELEKRYEAIENEGNEWKTRFETQEEINQQLEKQVILLQDKVEEAKRNLKDADLVEIYQQKKIEVLTSNDDRARAFVEGRLGNPPTTDGSDTPKSKSTGITINISVSPQAGKSPRDMKNFDDLSDANPAMVKGMEKEKHLLYNQLRDLEWRLDQESKAYHKANDERKQYVLEINTTKGNIDGNKARQRAAVNLQQREVDDLSRSPRLLGESTSDLQKLASSSPRRKNRKDARLPVGSGGSVTSRVSTKSRSTSSRASRKLSIASTRSTVISSNMGSKVPSLSNIPEDQRILDPRRGPIKKTAAVKTLPSLDT